MKLVTTVKQTPVDAYFEVRHAGHCTRLSYPQLFVKGYVHWLAKRYAEASKIFDALTTVKDRGPRAQIMLAHCKAMLGDYAGCSATLSDALSIQTFNDAATDLHDAFVMWKCGFFVDVKTGLEKVVSEHEQLPTPCLMLADLRMQSGGAFKSHQLLALAIERDRPDGAIATIARRKLSLAQPQSSKRKKLAEIAGEHADAEPAI